MEVVHEGVVDEIQADVSACNTCHAFAVFASIEDKNGITHRDLVSADDAQCRALLALVTAELNALDQDLTAEFRRRHGQIKAARKLVDLRTDDGQIADCDSSAAIGRSANFEHAVRA